MTANVHFVGIGGIHMSALAHILLDDGVIVSGCDRVDAPILQPLRERGARILIGHRPSHVTTATRVIRTAAVPADHPEIAAASKLGIPCQTRAELLAQIASSRDVIAVGGSHGKTTTTALVARAMQASGRDVGYVLGGESPDFEVHARRGTDPWLVLEADEYARAFHHYSPSVAVLTNAEPDHLDYYGSAVALTDAFLQYTRTIRREGALVVGIDSPVAAEIAERLAAERPDVRVYSFATDREADYRIEPDGDDRAGQQYSLETPTATLRSYLELSGQYNLRNAAAALAATEIAGFDLAESAAAISDFQGVQRRFQVVGEHEGVVVLDDYAHHPTEVRAALAAARDRYPERRLVVLFQPHTYTRTQYLLDGFKDCFSAADQLYVAETYAAREDPELGMSAAQLAPLISSPCAMYSGSVAETAAAAAAAARPNDLIITMGAGDIDAAPAAILEHLRGRL